MKKSRSHNPSGRPKEYADKMRTISLCLPESLIETLDTSASNAGASRQRLIIEWLMMSSILEWAGHLQTSDEGTLFDKWPKITIDEPDRKKWPVTNREAADHFTAEAARNPDDLVVEWQYLVFRDKEIDLSKNSESKPKKRSVKTGKRK